MQRPSTNAMMAAHNKCVNMNVAIAANAPNSSEMRMTTLMLIAVPVCWSHRSAFEPFNAGELSPGPGVETDEEILAWVAEDAETALHPSCTAKMGTDDMSVVDPLTMKVHGLDGLRVVDASVMPYVTNGNIYAPVMMVAEKAADLILGATPLPAEPTEFYRHKKPRKRSTSK